MKRLLRIAMWDTTDYFRVALFRSMVSVIIEDKRGWRQRIELTPEFYAFLERLLTGDSRWYLRVGKNEWVGVTPETAAAMCSTHKVILADQFTFDEVFYDDTTAR